MQNILYETFCTIDQNKIGLLKFLAARLLTTSTICIIILILTIKIINSSPLLRLVVKKVLCFGNFWFGNWKTLLQNSFYTLFSFYVINNLELTNSSQGILVTSNHTCHILEMFTCRYRFVFNYSRYEYSIGPRQWASFE